MHFSWSLPPSLRCNMMPMCHSVLVCAPIIQAVLPPVSRHSQVQRTERMERSSGTRGGGNPTVPRSWRSRGNKRGQRSGMPVSSASSCFSQEQHQKVKVITMGEGTENSGKVGGRFFALSESGIRN